MIEKVWFRNFMMLRDVDLPLKWLTVLVGPNASGKSSVLRGLHLVLSNFRRGAGVVQGDASFLGVQGIDALRSRLEKTITRPVDLAHESLEEYQLMCYLGMSGVWKSYPGEVLFGLYERTNKDAGSSYGFMYAGDWKHPSAQRDSHSRLVPFNVVPDALLLQSDAKVLGEPSHVADVEPTLKPDGYGLASVLAHWKLSKPELFEAVEERLRAVVPTVRRIRVGRAMITTPAGNGEVQHVEQRVGEKLIFDMKGADGVPAEFVSEGTLLTLGLLTAILGQERPTLVLFDDIERGLHPRAIADLFGQIRILLEQNPELQIVATTHSPYLVDHLAPEEVCLTTIGDDGYAAVARLDEHPEFERWKGHMAPGEFWSTVGEDWVRERHSPAASDEGPGHE